MVTHPGVEYLKPSPTMSMIYSSSAYITSIIHPQFIFGENFFPVIGSQQIFAHAMTA